MKDKRVLITEAAHESKGRIEDDPLTLPPRQFLRTTLWASIDPKLSQQVTAVRLTARTPLRTWKLQIPVKEKRWQMWLRRLKAFSRSKPT